MKQLQQVTEDNITYKIGDYIYDMKNNYYGKINDIWEVEVAFGNKIEVIYNCISDYGNLLDSQYTYSGNIIPAEQAMKNELKELKEKHTTIRNLIKG